MYVHPYVCLCEQYMCVCVCVCVCVYTHIARPAQVVRHFSGQTPNKTCNIGFHKM